MIYLVFYVFYMLQGKVLMNKCQDVGIQLDLFIVINFFFIIGLVFKECFDVIDINSVDCVFILFKIVEFIFIMVEKVYSNIN